MRQHHHKSESPALLRCVSLADGLTIANGICGLLVVATALGSLSGRGGVHGLSHGRLMICGCLIVLGGIFDTADGAVAHWRGGSGMGCALDTMADALTFGVAPATLLIATEAGAPGPWRLLVLPVACVLLAAAMLRLARFSTFPAPSDGVYFGLPMPAAAGSVLALVVIRPAPAVMLAGVLLISSLMVSEIHYPHPGRRMVPLLIGYWIALAATVALNLPAWPAAVSWLGAVAVLAIASGSSPSSEPATPHPIGTITSA